MKGGWPPRSCRPYTIALGSNPRAARRLRRQKHQPIRIQPPSQPPIPPPIVPRRQGWQADVLAQVVGAEPAWPGIAPELPPQPAAQDKQAQAQAPQQHAAARGRECRSRWNLRHSFASAVRARLLFGVRARKTRARSQAIAGDRREEKLVDMAEAAKAAGFSLSSHDLCCFLKMASAGTAAPGKDGGRRASGQVAERCRPLGPERDSAWSKCFSARYEPGSLRPPP